MFPTFPTIGRAAAIAGRRGTTALAVALLTMGGLGLTGCSVIRAVNHIKNAVEGNKATIDSFTQALKNGKAVPFEATYVTTGSAPTTVVYAVQPPKEVAFKESASSGGAANLNLIINSSGEYSCTQPVAGAATQCEKLGNASAAAQNQIFNIYTPSHWIVFLTDFSIAAGFAGDKVTSSTMSVNGFNLKCVDFNAPGVKGTSTICSTDQGILGYVKVAGSPTSFEIKSYTGSPSASLFALPAGAKVTNVG